MPQPQERHLGLLSILWGADEVIVEDVMIDAREAVKLAMWALDASERRDMSRAIKLLVDAERLYRSAKELAVRADSKIASGAVSVAASAVRSASDAYLETMREERKLMSDEYNPEREAIMSASLSVDASELAKKLATCGRLLSAESLLHNAALLFDLAEEDARDSGSDVAYMNVGHAHAALTSARNEYNRAKSAEEEDE